MKLLHNCICNYLIELGFSPRKKAFHYFVYLIELSVTEIDFQLVTSKYLLSYVSKRYSSPTESIRKVLYLATESIWDEKRPLLKKIFPTYSSNKYAPQFTDFFAYLVVYFDNIYRFEYLNKLTANTDSKEISST